MSGEGPSALAQHLQAHGLRLASRLGTGASGQVVKAIDEQTGNRPVAVKVFDGVDDRYAAESLAREIDAVVALRHANIVNIHRAYLNEPPAFVVMELVEPRPGNLPLTVADTLDSGVQLSSALAHAHEQGIIHSDIKPANILWRDGRQPLLSDFGSAKIDAVTRFRSGIGFQPRWSPPWMTDPSFADQASDVWSLAASISWLLWQQEPPELDLGSAAPTELATLLSGIMTASREESVSQIEPALTFGHRLQKLQNQIGLPITSMTGPGQDDWTLQGVETVAVPRYAPTAVTPIDNDHSNTAETQGKSADQVGADSPAVTKQLKGGFAFAAAALVAAVAIVAATGPLLTNRDSGSPGAPTATDSSTQVTAESLGSDQPEATDATDAPTTSAIAPSSATPTTTTSQLVTRSLTDGATASTSDFAPDGFDGCGAATSFEPDNVLDGRVETAWRVAGSGIGQTITITFDGARLITEVGLIPGYAKIDPCDNTDRFFQSRRITEVVWTLGQTQQRQRLDPDSNALQVEGPSARGEPTPR